MTFSAMPILRATRRQIRVLTVDEHQLVQEGLAAMINREEDMTVVATASSGEEAIDCGRQSEQALPASKRPAPLDGTPKV